MLGERKISSGKRKLFRKHLGKRLAPDVMSVAFSVAFEVRKESVHWRKRVTARSPGQLRPLPVLIFCIPRT